MKKIHLIEEWDYMDPKPSNTYVALEETKIQDWVKHMSENYASGTTKYIRTLEEAEARSWALNEIHKIITKPWVTRTNSDLDSVDVERIKNIYKMLDKAYQA